MKKLVLNLPSLLLIIFGGMVMFGWWLKIPALIQFSTSSGTVAFNAALGFVLSGIALFLFRESLFLRAQFILGIILALIGGLTFCEIIFNIDFHIDQLLATDWWAHFYFSPGRMAPNSALGFLLTGLFFVLLPKGHNRIVAITIEVILFFLIIISLLGISGYLFSVEFLYSWYNQAHMALFTAMAFILLSVSLWRVWRSHTYSSAWYRSREETKILLASSGILLLVALVAGLASFVGVAKQQNNAIEKAFSHLVDNQANVFIRSFSRVADEAEAIRSNPLFQKTFAENSQQINSNRLQPLLQLFIAEGFSAVSFYDKSGKKIATEGDFIESPEIETKLNLPNQPSLIWKSGWFLRQTISINPKNKEAGFFRAEWPLKYIDQVFDSNQGQGPSAEFVVCANAENNGVQCFPSRLTPQAHWIPNSIMGKPVPVFLGISGKHGIDSGYDYRGQKIIAAYAPIGSTGLGLVFKINEKDLYESFIESLRLILPIVGIAILIGIALLRLAVLPLLRRVVETEYELSQTNKLLTQSDERYALAVSGSQAGLWDWEVGSEDVFYAHYFKKMLGYRDDEFPNKSSSFFDVLHPDDVDRVKGLIEEHLKNNVPFNIEYRLKLKSGEYHWFQAMGEAVRNSDGIATRMAGATVDISDRREIQERQAAQFTITQLLSEATNLEEVVPKILRTICESMDLTYGGIWLIDFKKNVMCPTGMWAKPGSSTDQFKQVSSQMTFAQGEGSPGRVWQTARLEKFLAPFDKGQFARYKEIDIAGFRSGICLPILLGYKVLGIAEFFSTKDKVPDEETLKMLEAIGPQLGQFIQRKAVEEALQISETQKTAILESASDSIITTKRSGEILSYNAQTEKMFGYSALELRIININELVPGLINEITSMEEGPPKEFKALRSNSTEFPIELTISGMYENNQHAYVSIIRDITERKKIEAFKNEFISIVSHELRTPLTSIRGSLGLVLGGAVGEFSEKASNLLTIANHNCERLLLLINDILDIEKIEAGKMIFKFQPLDIDDLVQESIKANQMYAEKYNVTLTLVQSAPQSKVNVDPDRLMQVLSNLISNAAKFSPKGGIVELLIEVIGRFIRVSVRDHGPGISEEFQTQIFQKFSQADSSASRGKGGTGLGLSISKAIIEKMGGELNFESHKGSGAVFYFDLPEWHENQGKEEAIDRDASSAKYMGKLLICEDDEDQANFLRVTLESSGYYVDVAYDVTHAKELLSRQRYDALLLDLILPDENGVAFIRQLRSVDTTRDLPVIVISMISDTGRSLLNGEALTVMDWLSKPVDFQKLLKVIKNIKKRTGNSLPHILHIEDDKDMQEVVAEILRSEATVVHANNVAEAREKVQHEFFELVILDLMLPDGSGTDLLPLIARKHIPVIVFSAIELDKTFAKYVSGALVKSKTTNDELLEQIKILIDRHN